MDSGRLTDRREKVLVTGGCGFIGSHLVEALLKRGVRVRVLDDLSTGKRSNLPAEVEVIVGDVANYRAVRESISGVDACFHLAAIASVARSTTDWAGTSRINLGGAVNVLDAARSANQGSQIPVVFASSAAVYGGSPVSPLPESIEGAPLSAYGADKRACELHAAVASRLHRVPAVGLRFFNVYGPRQDPSSAYSGVISRFADAIFRGAAIEIHGDGDQVRDFVFVADVVDALLRSMERAYILAPAVFNVCTGRATSIRDLARVMHAEAGARLRITGLPPRAGDIRASVGNPAKASDDLDWRSRTTLDVGLGKTLAWYRESLCSTEAPR